MIAATGQAQQRVTMEAILSLNWRITTVSITVRRAWSSTVSSENCLRKRSTQTWLPCMPSRRHRTLAIPKQANTNAAARDARHCRLSCRPSGKVVNRVINLVRKSRRRARSGQLAAPILLISIVLCSKITVSIRPALAVLP